MTYLICASETFFFIKTNLHIHCQVILSYRFHLKEKHDDATGLVSFVMLRSSISLHLYLLLACSLAGRFIQKKN